MRHRTESSGHRRNRAIPLALITGILTSGIALSPPAATPAVAVEDPVANGSTSAEDHALAQAQATGQPYELVSARTETTDTWAQPDGTWSVRRYGGAIRVLRDGVWVATDPTLVFAAGGAVKPKASLVDVTFSGGGTAPLLSGVKDGRNLTLAWPKALPMPTLDENVATYAEVLPGVDLQLKAEVEGFSQLLVVKTAEAAKNPELASLKFKFSTVGLDVSTDPDTGSVLAVDPAGQTVFTSPSPTMWDSTTATSEPAPAAASTFSATTAATTSEEPAPADAFEPPPGSNDAPMPTTVTGDTLEIKPDQALLTDADTQYPVFIDPSWDWGKKQNWTRVYKHYPRTSFWNTKDPIRVGYEAETGGSDRISRSFVQLDTTPVMGADVKKATFRIRNTWSWSCESRPVQLWQTGDISRKTNWSNQPGKIGTVPLGTVNDSKGWSKDCAAGNLEFDVTNLIKSRAKPSTGKPKASVTLGLYASDESDTFGWKKFDAKTAVLEFVYNNPPKKPEDLGTHPKTDCSTGGVIGNTRVSLHATTDDKDAGNLFAEFRLFKPGVTTPFKTEKLPALKDRVTTWSVPDADLPTGDYTWNVVARDQDGAASVVSKTCKFTVDRTRPSKPPVISSTVFPNGEKGWPATTGRARSEGAFTFDPNGVTDVRGYHYWSDSDPEVKEVAPGQAAKVTPPSYGPHFVYAYSVDGAGNRSDVATYLYYATRSATRDIQGDLNGDGIRDIWSVDSNGTLMTYASQGAKEFNNATNAGGSFTGKQVANFGDWHEDGYNDLVSLEYDAVDKRKKIRVYPNDGTGRILPSKVSEPTVTCPVADPEIGCESGDDHWADADQVAAPGDLNRDGQPDLLVKQGKLLWAYYGNRATKDLDLAYSRAPALVGGTDWDRFTLITPGDVNADGLPDLWLREDATGDTFRALATKAGTLGEVDTAKWGLPASRLKIGFGVPAKDYPVIGSSGDMTNDPAGSVYADLWARKSDNTMLGWPGRAPEAGTNTSFSSRFTIDGVTGGAYIPTGTTIASGQSYTSNSAKLTMQADGNLVITSDAGKVMWQTNTAGNPGATALMQSNGNLVVYPAGGGDSLWESKSLAADGYALLQDRGNLVIYNTAGQSKWSSNTVVRHDYNGDGRSDMAAWYVAADNRSSLNSFLTNSDGTFQGPLKGYESQVGSWNISRMKFATGDYNGDGRGDMAALYDYGDGVVKLFTSLGQADGKLGFPFVSWSSGKGGYYSGSMTLNSGDFNGDGRDDLMAWYSYWDGRDTLFTFTSNVSGGFNAPFPSHQEGATGWDVNRSKFITGDFNGDGREDLSALYGYGNGDLKALTFLALPNGGFANHFSSWAGTATGWGDWNRTHPHAGDFNGDGLDDMMLWYDYADGHDAMFLAAADPLNRTGKFATSTTLAWQSAIGNWSYGQMKIVPGDYDGDGRDDIGSMFGYSDGSVRMFTHTAGTNGALNGAKAGWSTISGWNWSKGTFLRHYS
ncbi:FG-GAP-like repeat-containing protein [Streptomyces sp. NPDC012888]|uniref:FG-GAP-like repeat-containing protein n=1 Tax=Streptomyces sp. NPDC012888 TaxID=3364855 RepID=UPI0036BC0187